MTVFTLSNVKRLDIDINVYSGNKVQPSKVLTKIYDAFNENKPATYGLELIQEPEWSLRIIDSESKERKIRAHIKLFDDLCHFSFWAEDNPKKWLNIVSALADKTMLLLTTYGFNIKNIEIESNFDVNEIFVPFESLIDNTELGKVVSDLNMSLTPVSLMFLSEFSGWTVVIIAPKSERKDKELPTSIILHRDIPKHQEGMLTNAYQAAMDLEAKLHKLKAGATT